MSSNVPNPDMQDRIPTLTTEISDLNDAPDTATPPATEAATDTMADSVDPALVLELQERGQRQLLAMPLGYWPLVIGRAATADLVLTDPSIAAEQVRLHRLPDGVVEVEVLDPINGVWLGKRHYRAGERFAWPIGSKLAVSRSLVLCLRGSQQTLPPAVRWRPTSRWQGLITTLALLMVVGLTALVNWLGATKSDSLMRELPSAVLGMLGIMLVWSLLWSIISKLFTGVTSFWRHVGIVAVATVLWMAAEQLLAGAAFAFSMPVLTRYTSLINLVAGTLMIWFHLRAATYVKPRTLGTIMAVLLLLVAGTKLGMQWQSQKQLSDSMYMSTILPPQWRMAPAVPVKQFIDSTNALRDALDKRAKDKEGQEGDDDTEDDGLD